VKKSVEITLTSIHVGGAREVVTLAIDGKDPAQKYLSKLAKKDPKAFESLKTRIKAVAEHDRYENSETFREVGDGVFEFKRNSPRLLRLYAFYDEIAGVGQLILCTNGGDKTSQDHDILAAKRRKVEYLLAKKEPHTVLIHEKP
jgi:putative component of toxin-antitoxin plasmid stabilization module